MQRKKGAIILATGGDNSNSAKVRDVCSCVCWVFPHRPTLTPSETCNVCIFVKFRGTSTKASWRRGWLQRRRMRRSKLTLLPLATLASISRPTLNNTTKYAGGRQWPGQPPGRHRPRLLSVAVGLDSHIISSTEMPAQQLDLRRIRIAPPATSTLSSAMEDVKVGSGAAGSSVGGASSSAIATEGCGAQLAPRPASAGCAWEQRTTRRPDRLIDEAAAKQMNDCGSNVCCVSRVRPYPDPRSRIVVDLMAPCRMCTSVPTKYFAHSTAKI